MNEKLNRNRKVKPFRYVLKQDEHKIDFQGLNFPKHDELASSSKNTVNIIITRRRLGKNNFFEKQKML